MKQKISYGFTLIEVLVVLGIFILFLGFLTINIMNIEPKTSLKLDTSTVIADIKKQQLRAMTGDSFNNQPLAFGIFLESNRYTLFGGSTYQAGNPGNSVIALPDNTLIQNITFPGSVIVFLQNSGVINNFVNGANTFAIRNSITNDVKTVTFNKLGTVVQVQ